MRSQEIIVTTGKTKRKKHTKVLEMAQIVQKCISNIGGQLVAKIGDQKVDSSVVLSTPVWLLGICVDSFILRRP